MPPVRVRAVNLVIQLRSHPAVNGGFSPLTVMAPSMVTKRETILAPNRAADAKAHKSSGLGFIVYIGCRSPFATTLSDAFLLLGPLALQAQGSFADDDCSFAGSQSPAL